MLKTVVKSVAKNSTIMLAQTVISWGATFFLMLFLARYLGPVEYGRLFLAASIVGIFRVVVEYGGTYLVAKQVARNPDDPGQIVADQLGYRIILAVFSVVGMLIFSQIADYPHATTLVIMVIGIGLTWKGLHTVLYAMFQGLERMQYTSTGSITESLFNNLLGVVALFLGAKALTIAAISQVASLLNVLLLVWFARKFVTAIPRIRWKQSLLAMKEGLPYFLFAVFSTIYYRIDTIMLSKMTPEHVVGWYGAAYRLFEMQNAIPFIISVAVYPALARLSKTTEDGGLKQATQKGLEYVVVAGIPATVVVVSFADHIVSLFYGLPDYLPTVILLQLLVVGLVLLYIDMAIGTTLLAVDRQKQMSILSLCAIPVNVLLNYFMIPYTQEHYGNGAIGAAIATTITEAGIMITGLNMLPRHLMEGFRVRLVLKCILAGLLTVGAGFLLRQAPVSWVISGVILFIVYGVLLVLFRTFDQTEMSFFKEILNVRSFSKRLRGVLGNQEK
jgi:O-antigen/teichoic acid export membrane protein